MSALALGRHLMWSRPNADGGTTYFYYYDEITWVVGALALAWLTWWLVRRRGRERALRRRRRRGADYRLLGRAVKAKSELSARYLGLGVSANIHAVGVGALGGGGYCIQIFIRDENEELWPGAGAAALPESHGGFPVVALVARQAVLLSDAGRGRPEGPEQYRRGIRDRREVIVGGISGANANLTGESGTIGYFCKRKTVLPRPLEVCLLSNSHTLADLLKGKVDDGDVITQPSPGERASNRPIGSLVNFSPLKFGGGPDEPNHVDAALARLWPTHPYELVIPFIGEVKGYVVKRDVAVGEAALKTGRTTGFTQGLVCSIYLDIRVGYQRTGQSAFFRDQLMIEPALPRFTKFVDAGDSGSLVTDAGRHAIGLIFAGTPDAPDSQAAPPSRETATEAADRPRRVENYGVANPISEVLTRLRVELLVKA